MNIVFWLLIVVALLAIWYACLPLFGVIGGAAKNVKEEIEDELKGENEDE